MTITEALWRVDKLKKALRKQEVLYTITFREKKKLRIDLSCAEQKISRLERRIGDINSTYRRDIKDGFKKINKLKDDLFYAQREITNLKQHVFLLQHEEELKKDQNG